MMSDRALVDASAILAVINSEPARELVLNVTRDLRPIGAQSLPFEVANALTSGMKRGKATLEQALAGIRLFESMELELVPIDAIAAIRLAAKHGLYAYDAGVLVVARELDVPLLTFDRGMIHVARAEKIRLAEVAT